MNPRGCLLGAALGALGWALICMAVALVAWLLVR